MYMTSVCLAKNKDAKTDPNIKVKSYLSTILIGILILLFVIMIYFYFLRKHLIKFILKKS